MILLDEQTAFHSQLQSSGQENRTRPPLYKEPLDSIESTSYIIIKVLQSLPLLDSFSRTTKLRLDPLLWTSQAWIVLVRSRGDL